MIHQYSEWNYLDNALAFATLLRHSLKKNQETGYISIIETDRPLLKYKVIHHHNKKWINRFKRTALEILVN